jgi:hypothetical protein
MGKYVLENNNVLLRTRWMVRGFGGDEQRQVVASAEEMWTLWLNFFTSLRERML